MDNLGKAVFGASVTGTFTGDITTETVIEITNGGQAVLTTEDTAHGRLEFTFCVVNVIHSTLTYGGVETCDSN